MGRVLQKQGWSSSPMSNSGCNFKTFSFFFRNGHSPFDVCTENWSKNWGSVSNFRFLGLFILQAYFEFAHFITHQSSLFINCKYLHVMPIIFTWQLEQSFRLEENLNLKKIKIQTFWDPKFQSKKEKLSKKKCDNYSNEVTGAMLHLELTETCYQYLCSCPCEGKVNRKIIKIQFFIICCQRLFVSL